MRVFSKISIGLVSLFILQACVTEAVPVRSLPEPVVSQQFDRDQTRPLKFQRLVFKLPRNEVFGTIQVGALCIPNREIIWDSASQRDLDPTLFSEIFVNEMEAHGIRAIGENQDLFGDGDQGDVDLRVGGRVLDLAMNNCFPFAGFGNWRTIRGNAEMQVEWQIYDVESKQVIHKVKTRGSHVMGEQRIVPETFSLEEAFGQAARNLLNDRTFQRIIANKEDILPNQSKRAAQKSRLAVPKGSQARIAKSPVDYQNATVKLSGGGGHGSGFFISDKGYILTNQHVVRNRNSMRVELQDGREFLGQVLRRDPKRDVALVKVNFTPDVIFNLSKRLPEIGEDTTVVGAPLDERLQGTISRGIVSNIGNLLDDDLALIQSDANIAGGNSGGPMVNNKGEVIGISVSGLNNKYYGADTSGLNFFIPIQEGLTALNISVR